MLLTCFSEAIPLTAQESMGYSLPPSLSFTELDWDLESETLEISVLAVGAPDSAKNGVMVRDLKCPSHTDDCYRHDIDDCIDNTGY